MPQQPSSQTDAQPEHVRIDFDPAAGVAAILFPGLGYFVRGAPRRGVYLMIGVLGLVLIGLFIGGLDWRVTNDELKKKLEEAGATVELK